jgi:hypothetical protein
VSRHSRSMLASSPKRRVLTAYSCCAPTPGGHDVTLFASDAMSSSRGTRA